MGAHHPRGGPLLEMMELDVTCRAKGKKESRKCLPVTEFYTKNHQNFIVLAPV